MPLVYLCPLLNCSRPLHGRKDKCFRGRGEEEAAGNVVFLLSSSRSTFVIGGSTINHVGGGVSAQWLCSAGGLSLWVPGS